MGCKKIMLFHTQTKQTNKRFKVVDSSSPVRTCGGIMPAGGGPMPGGPGPGGPMPGGIPDKQKTHHLLQLSLYASAIFVT